MIKTDLDDALDLEQICFPSSPWERAFFEHELDSPESICLVAASSQSSDASITGYIVAYTFMDEMHVMNIAVEPQMRRRGIAADLLEHAISIAGEGVKYIYLEVRRSNRYAQKFYEKMGFICIGVKKDYYREEGEDAIIMGLEV